jgi:hypothetical protein
VCEFRACSFKLQFPFICYFLLYFYFAFASAGVCVISQNVFIELKTFMSHFLSFMFTFLTQGILACAHSFLIPMYSSLHICIQTTLSSLFNSSCSHTMLLLLLLLICSKQRLIFRLKNQQTDTINVVSSFLRTFTQSLSHTQYEMMLLCFRNIANSILPFLYFNFNNFYLFESMSCDEYCFQIAKTAAKMWYCFVFKHFEST